jgi:hypothetical protein
VHGRPGLLASAVVLVALSGCGGGGGTTTVSTKTPLTLPAASRQCPARFRPLPRVGKEGGGVLVPGRPTSAVICRYYEDSDVRPRGVLAEAREIVRADVLGYLTSKLDSLPAPTRHENCDEVMGGRADLYVFGYRHARDARVLILRAGCFPATNGRIVRNAIGAGHGNEVHWEDEELMPPL